MQSTRQNKISRLIQQDLGDIFLREMKPVLGNSLITVTGVRMEPATKQGIIDAILTHSADIRRRLGLREGKQLRIIPQLDYFLDDSLDMAERIDNLLKQ